MIRKVWQRFSEWMMLNQRYSDFLTPSRVWSVCGKGAKSARRRGFPRQKFRAKVMEAP
jgi:hypothetical protein